MCFNSQEAGETARESKKLGIFFSTHHKFASATVDDSEIRRPAVVR